MVLRECETGEWAWLWQRPDGECEMGLDDNPEAAADHLAQEVKDGSKRPSEQRLTPEQVEWHRRWPSPVAVVLDVPSALRAVGAIPAEDRV